MVKAILKNYRQSPRKVRLVADIIRGKKATHAVTLLAFTAKRSALPIKKLLESAIANAKHNFQLEPESLYVKEIMVDEGVTMYRSMPRARGSSAPIRKRTCHVRLVLAEIVDKKKAKKDSSVEVVAESDVVSDSSKKETSAKVAKKSSAKKTDKKVKPVNKISKK